MNYQARWSEPDAEYQGFADVEDELRYAIRPEPVLTVSQWADKYRVLSTKLAAEAGNYRTDRVPFLRDVMDALSPMHTARRVVFMKSAQVGATEAGNNWLGYIMHWSPAPVMGVWPTVDTAKKVSQQRVQPLIDDCPELRAIMGDAKSRDSGNTVLAKTFPGGILVMTGANSGVGLRSMPARYAFLDEVDAYPGDVDGEGDPIALVANRTTTFGRKAKMFLVSTPTIHGESRIEREYEKSDQRRYFIPCPDCGGMQWLKWERLKWDPGKPESAHYACEHCGVYFEERHKTAFLAKGEWRATATPSDPHSVGFHISGLYSPLGWLSWEEMAREWEEAQGDVSKLKTFKNTRLGETWFEASELVDWERIYERRESWQPGTLPSGVTLLTAAVDVQASPARLELHVWGWGDGLESWAVERRVLYGPADDPKTWAGVEQALDDTWRHVSGVQMKIDLLAVDTGDQTTAVYGWISKQDQARVLAIKGRRGYEANAPVASPTNIPFGRRKRAIRLRMVTGDVFKAELYRFLLRGREEDGAYPQGYVHVPDFMDAEWCKQLVAERRVRNKTGRYEWKIDHKANEALDCRVYSRAALWTRGVASWSPERWKREREVRGLDAVPVERVQQTQPRANSFLGERRRGWLT
ncbi:Phage terminase large subunit family protein [Hyphomicrobiales bacterium]|nr:Phage terminase large subunit family protein [Hyphomicrobiales bacterium]CAH1669277.1 Phage terminase large subunit family protein [Hyphomicrobiales bacterium]